MQASNGDHVITSPEGGPLSRTVLDGTGGRSWPDRPGVAAREPWLLDSTRFCSSGGGGGASSSSSAIVPLLLTLLPRGDDGEEEEEEEEDEDDDDENENEGLDETARRLLLLDRNLSRLWPRRRNPPTITGSCEEKPCTRAPAHDGRACGRARAAGPGGAGDRGESSRSRSRRRSSWARAWAAARRS